MRCPACDDVCTREMHFCSNCGADLQPPRVASAHPLPESPVMEFSGSKGSRGRSLWVLGLVLIIGLGSAGYLAVIRPAQEREQKERELAIKRTEFLKSFKDMSTGLDGLLSKIEQAQRGQRRFAGLQETDITVGENGSFTVVGLEVMRLGEEAAKAEATLKQKLAAIRSIAQQAGLEDDPEINAALAKYEPSNASAKGRDNPNVRYPDPTPGDIAFLTNHAEQVRSTIASLPRAVPGGDERYNDMVVQAAGAGVGPVARQFNSTCATFQARYGRANLVAVARQGGFSDLLPKD